MPVIQQYEERVQAQGQIGGQASANDFGAQVGQAQTAMTQGLESVGKAAQAVGNDIYAVEHNDAIVNAYTVISKNAVTQTKSYQDEVATIPMDDPVKYREVRRAIDDKYTNPETGLYFKSINDLATNAPNSITANKIKQLGSRGAIPFFSNVSSSSARSINESYIVQGEQIAKNNDAYLELHAGDPNAYKYIVDATRSSIDSMVDATGEMKFRLQSQLLNKAAVSAVSAVAASPKTAVSLLNAVNPGGGYITKNRTAYSANGDYTTVASNLMPALVQAESSGRQSAVSSKGAIGVAQIMPETGPEAAKLAGLEWDEKKFKSDAEYNGKLGEAYLTKQLKKFDGDPIKALSAYNWGPGATQDAINMHGDSWFQHAPTETKNYVEKVLKAANLGEGSGARYPQIKPASEEQIMSASIRDLPAWQDLNPDQRVHFSRIAEATVGKQMAADRGQITKTLRDVDAAASIGQGMSPEQKALLDPENLKIKFGEEEARPLIDFVNQKQKFASLYNSMQPMSLAAAQMSVDSFKPTPGDLNYVEKLQDYQRAQQALMKRQQDISNDPMQYAINNKINGVGALDFTSTERLTNSFVSRISAYDTMTSEFGAPKIEGLLTKGEAENLTSFLASRPVDDQITMLRSLKNSTQSSTELYSKTLGQMSKHSDGIAYAGNLLAVDTPESNQAARTVLQGIKIAAEGKQGKLDLPQFKMFFDAVVGEGAFSNVAPDIGAEMRNNVYNAAYAHLNAETHRTGATLKYNPSVPSPTADMNKGIYDAVKNSIDAVSGGFVQVNPTSKLIKPFDVTEKEFTDQFAIRAKNALIMNGYADAARNIPNLRFKNTQDAGKYMVHGQDDYPIQSRVDGGYIYVDLNGAGR